MEYWCLQRKLQVGCYKYGFLFSKLKNIFRASTSISSSFCFTWQAWTGIVVYKCGRWFDYYFFELSEATCFLNYDQNYRQNFCFESFLNDATYHLVIVVYNFSVTSRLMSIYYFLQVSLRTENHPFLNKLESISYIAPNFFC